MREIAFDTETTGLSPHDGHRLVEIGCVELVGRVETGRHFHCYIHPERSMPPEAEAVHGLSEAFLRAHPTFAEQADAFLDFIGDAPLVAHNATFDFGFLNAELERGGWPIVPLSRMVDTLALAKQRHPGAKLSLDALCTRYGIDRSQRIKHGALVDAQLLAQVYIELTGGRQIGLVLGDEAGDAGTPRADAPAARPVRPPRPHGASAAELAAHAAFVSTLTDPLWAKLPATA